MKVIAINGSPHAEGNTFSALNAVCEQLAAENIECEIIHIGNQAVRGCVSCRQCSVKLKEECVLRGDEVNAWIQKIKAADGLILGSPVYFAGIAGTMKCFLDRAFYVAGSNYWNVAYGTAPGEVLLDSEGMQIMRVLGKNMAWLLKAKETSPLPLPEPEKKTYFSFIRK